MESTIFLVYWADWAFKNLKYQVPNGVYSFFGLLGRDWAFKNLKYQVVNGVYSLFVYWGLRIIEGLKTK